ncbi:hypothetical protein KDH_72860 [Dictyobacter sp. S3.2.2.5]|uniref:Uncharacterized protein n=1 Tax=Dictyobacter halimunensis TaxID=3026934 RepID=A0ABQ6G783_9CHLR|nr:hypothetical protein KDH_72860 [Dictyobacter sp. S3.2.2.5]
MSPEKQHTYNTTEVAEKHLEFVGIVWPIDSNGSVWYIWIMNTLYLRIVRANVPASLRA